MCFKMTPEEILGKIDKDISEIHIVGGHHPTWKFEYYENIVKEIHQKFPHIQIKGFTAAEIDYFWRRWKIDPEESLARLKEAGLASMPGGGAEVFSPRIHKMLLPGKSNSSRWLEIHKTAHTMGIKSNCTILYGHLETYEERRKNCCVSRSFGIPHIKSYWVTIGESTASVGLNFGADDLDGTIGEEKIMHAASASSPAGLARTKMISLISEAGKIPVERDALYNEVKTYAY